jgi:hypothetical protein
MPIDYSKAKIYKIIDNTNDNVYVGSTCKTLTKRLARHVKDYKYYLNGDKKYMSSYKILENKDFNIQLIEIYPCNSRDELHKREGYYIKNAANCVNKLIAGRTSTEYSEQHKEQKMQKSKDYYEQNKAVIAEQRKQKIICICGSETSLHHKARHERSKKHQSFIKA